MASGKESIVAQALEHGPKGKTAGKKSTAKKMVHAMSAHRVEGGHVVHHYHSPHEEGDGQKPDMTHVVQNGPGGEGDIDPLHAHMEDHLGAPNAGEADGATQALASIGGPGVPAPTANMMPAPAMA